MLVHTGAHLSAWWLKHLSKAHNRKLFITSILCSTIPLYSLYVKVYGFFSLNLDGQHGNNVNVN